MFVNKLFYLIWRDHFMMCMQNFLELSRWIPYQTNWQTGSNGQVHNLTSTSWPQTVQNIWEHSTSAPIQIIAYKRIVIYSENNSIHQWLIQFINPKCLNVVQMSLFYIFQYYFWKLFLYIWDMLEKRKKNFLIDHHYKTKIRIFW